MSNRRNAANILENLLERGVSSETILKWVLENYLSGDDSFEALYLFKKELLNN